MKVPVFGSRGKDCRPTAAMRSLHSGASACALGQLSRFYRDRCRPAARQLKPFLYLVRLWWGVGTSPRRNSEAINTVLSHRHPGADADFGTDCRFYLAEVLEHSHARYSLALLPFLEEPNPQWEFPRLCRGGSKSLTYPAVDTVGLSMKLRIVEQPSTRKELHRWMMMEIKAHQVEVANSS